MQFGRTKPFCTLFAGRIIRLRVWRHVGCSQYQESTGRGGKGHPIRASCSGIGLFLVMFRVIGDQGSPAAM